MSRGEKFWFALLLLLNLLLLVLHECYEQELSEYREQREDAKFSGR